jgi:hypothetical protein
MAAVERIVNEIEADLQRLNKPEIPSGYIGELVMEKLKAADHVAYIRFASVYREFQDVDGFRQTIDMLRQPASAGLPRKAGVPQRPPGQLALMPAMEVASPLTHRGGNRRRRGLARGPLARSQAPLKPVPGSR